MSIDESLYSSEAMGRLQEQCKPRTAEVGLAGYEHPQPPELPYRLMRLEQAVEQLAGDRLNRDAVKHGSRPFDHEVPLLLEQVNSLVGAVRSLRTDRDGGGDMAPRACGVSSRNYNDLTN